MATGSIGYFSIISPSQKRELERKRQKKEAREAAKAAKRAETARNARIARSRFIGDVLTSQFFDSTQYGVCAASAKSWMKRQMFHQVSCNILNT